MDLNKIEELIKVLEGSRAEEISLRKGEFAVHVKKGKKMRPAAAAPKPKAVSDKPSVQAAETPAKDKQVLAPMVGVFHTVDGPIKVGDRITAGQVVGTIESMKLLNDVVSELTGAVAGVFVDDGMPVEYGQALYIIEEA